MNNSSSHSSNLTLNEMGMEVGEGMREGGDS